MEPLYVVLFQKPDDLTGLCVSVQLRFLENRLPIESDFETTPARWNQLDVPVGPSVPELSRQTGGSRLIVSKSAVFDADFHACRCNACRCDAKEFDFAAVPIPG